MKLDLSFTFNAIRKFSFSPSDRFLRAFSQQKSTLFIILYGARNHQCRDSYSLIVIISGSIIIAILWLDGKKLISVLLSIPHSNCRFYNN